MENPMGCENNLDVFYILDWTGLRRFRFASQVSNLHEPIYFLNSFITRAHLSHIVKKKSKADNVKNFTGF